jgi:hypothetical protein
MITSHDAANLPALLQQLDLYLACAMPNFACSMTANADLTPQSAKQLITMSLFPHRPTGPSDQSSSDGDNDDYDGNLKMNGGSDGGVSLAEEEKRAMHVKIMMVRTALFLS